MNETNKKVPKFIEDLTHTYPRLLPKRDLLILLEDFWSKRQEQLNDFLKCLRDNVQSTLPSFNDFLYKYLKEAFGIEKIRREWSLSLYISGRVMTDCEELVRFRMVADNEIDEAYHWYLRSLTGRLFNQLREIAHATAIAFSMTTEPTGEKVTDVQLAKPKRSDCQLSVRQLSVVLAKLLQCTPDHESITRLIKIAFTNDDIDDSETTLQTGISMDATVSLEELFYRFTTSAGPW
uniref:HOOK domain-containing protein n=1 Tax=Mesocestoides corti TaxID=53468 RepID=A0A5K3FL53_MESCO